MNLRTSFTADNPSYDEIRDISEFTAAIRFTKVASLSHDNIRSAIADLIVKNLVQHLESTKIFGFSSIEVKTDNDIQVIYNDDVYHFAVVVKEDAFAIIRKSSTLSEFLQSCEIFMPFFSSVYRDVVAYIQGAVQNIVFVPHFCGYRFEFKIEDFRPATKTHKDLIPNYELMERLVPSIDKAESPVSKVGLERRGRTDLKVSGLLDLDDITWIGWLGIEAPGNKNYSTMEMSFELQSATLDAELGHGTRIPFDPRSIDSWQTALLAFLKDRIFCGFLQDWLGDVNVKSVRK